MPKPKAPDSQTNVDPDLEGLPRATRGFLLNAALVSRFKPEQLTALDTTTFDPIDPSESERNAALSFVIDNSSPSGFDDPARFGWSLNEELRARVLGALGGLDRVQAAVQHTPSGVADVEPLKLYFEQSKQSAGTALSELSARRQALVWLQPFLAGNDELRSLDKDISRQDLLAPLKQLAGDQFVGRTSELAFLRRFVGVLPAEPTKRAATLRGRLGSLGSTIGELGSEIYDWASSVLNDEDVVLVTAPGGMGKSALLARFILQHHEVAPRLRVPFAFLDFDRPSLLSREAWLPLEEIARQLSIQIDVEIVPPWRDPFPWMREISSEGPGRTPSSFAMEWSDADRAYLRRQDVRELAKRIAKGLHESSMRGKPLLLVIDTLERVFRRGRHWIAAIDEMIGLLRSEKISLRVVAGGRAYLSDARSDQTLGTRTIRWQERKLRELNPDAARELLVRLEVPKDAAAKIVDNVGGVPLTLYLAADFVKRHAGNVAALPEITRSWLFKRRLEDQIVQGHLYQRILSQIQESEVAKLACPGLVLREVTPALIRYVLAEPCGLGEVDDKKAGVLFEKLAEEFTLVEASGPQRLKHRSDVRQLMLKQMLVGDPDRSRRISEGAVRYFLKQTDLKSRAEEIYHRLLLGHDRETIDARWIEGLEEFLGEEIIDDIPSISLRVYTATRLNLTLRNEDWLREADQETWEQKVEQDFVARVKLGQVREALSLVEGRSEFIPGSPLYPLVAQAYADLGDYPAASQWIETGLQHVEWIKDPSRRRTLLDIFLVRARNFEDIVARNFVSHELARTEIEQLDALWREHPGDSQVLLVGLLESEALARKGVGEAAALLNWVLEKMRDALSSGNSVDPNIVCRVLAIVGRDPARLAVSRWLIEIAGVRELLLSLISELAARKEPPDDRHVMVLIDKLQQHPKGPARSASSGESFAGSELDATEVAKLASAVASAVARTRNELDGAAW